MGYSIKMTGLLDKMDQERSKLVEDSPIGNGLDAFRATFNSICKPLIHLASLAIKARRTGHIGGPF
jgi:hypothetical protein